MKAWVIERFGNPSVFELKDMPLPQVLPGHVLIRVRATSVNPIDTKIRSGAVKVGPDLPAVLQGDVAGIIEAVGEGVREFKVGDEVYGCAGGFKGTGGALGEYMLADTQLLALKPKSLSFMEAAALPLVSITAWEALIDRARITPGQKILIHAGTGGVGHFAIQIAKWAGATVYTTVSTTEKGQIAKDLGADYVINYKEQSVEDYVDQYTKGQGFDVVFDTVGGENLDRSFVAAKMQGTVVSIATRSTHDLSILHAKSLSLHVVFMVLPIVMNSGREKYGAILKQLTEISENGNLSPLLDKQLFSFDDVAKAHAYLESGKMIGKIVLENKW